MKKERTVEFMAWLTICVIVAIAATYTACRPLDRLDGYMVDRANIEHNARQIEAGMGVDR